ncbi:hypothetical protein [Aestuariivirga sp.]|uniref:hypothetical protein n=1 Tax=Aestuariivirga sp. TaxID=2650926 RepID=UPI00391A9179
MSKLMWISGILLIAAGIALGAMVFFAAAAVMSVGISAETAAILLVGGLLVLGLGSVIDSLEAQRVLAAERVVIHGSAPPAAAAIPEFGRRAADMAPPAAVTPAAATAAAAVSAAAPRETVDLSQPTRETIQALEQARQKIEQAFESKPAEAASRAVKPQPVPESRPAEEPDEQPAEEEAEEEADAEEGDLLEEGQLYVVEERIIRMRPARILSDGTVEAETDEGWMRFENLEHLDEYLDAMEPAKG